MGDANVVAPDTLSNVQVSHVCCGQDRFGDFGPKEVHGVDVALLLRKVCEVLLECQLRCLQMSNLDTLAKCLQPLAAPKSLRGGRRE